MAGPSSNGVNSCPTCGARANNSAIGRDGSPRRLGGFTGNGLSDDPVIVKRRNRAAALRRKNRSA